MITPPLSSAVAEEIVLLPAGSDSLVGVVTAPRASPKGRAVVLCPGGWFGTATNRNRVFVRMARRLADEGFTVLRFDWHGVGESAGTIDRYVLDDPFVDDVAAAVGYLGERGFADVTLVGVCFGARAAFGAAASPGVGGLVLLSFPVPNPADMTKASLYGARHGSLAMLRLAFTPAVLDGLRDHHTRRVYRKALRLKMRSLRTRYLRQGSTGPPTKRRRTSLTPSELLRQLTALADRGVVTNLVYGEDDVELTAFERFVDPPMRQLLDSPTRLVDVRTVPGQIHGFGTIAVQDQVVEAVVALATRTRPLPAPPSAEADATP
jgi:pimeloyl-ACP methyl ester carboxylesterase